MRFAFIFATVAAFAAPYVASGQSFSQATSQAEQRLNDALEELGAFRNQVADEKIPLSKELNKLQGELREERQELESALRGRDNRAVSLQRLKDTVLSEKDTIEYVEGLIRQMSDGMETRASVAELQLYAAEFDRFTGISIDADMETTISTQLDALEFAIKRVEKLIGGDSFPGKAMMPETEVFADGTFILYGPMPYFVAADGSAGGVVRKVSPENISPRLFPVDDTAESLTTVASTGAGDMPLDATAGSALAIAQTEETVLEHIQKGGIWIYPILTFALLSVLVGLVKVFEMASLGKASQSSIDKLLDLIDKGETAEAKKYAKSIKGPTGTMLVAASENLDVSRELLEEIMTEKIVETEPKVNRLLSFIATTAAVAPLLGLLGTVTGMINTFKLIAVFGTGDAGKLSKGISEALITTEFGLIVAIPALLLHAFLSRQAKSILARMETSAIRVSNAIQRVHERKASTSEEAA